MNIVYLITFIFIISFFVIERNCYKECQDRFESILASTFLSSLLTAFLTLLIILILSVLIKNEIGSKRIKQSFSVPIYSLKDSQKISGNFTLGSGRIDSVDMYHYYRKTPEGLFYRESVPTNKTFIREGTTKPSLKVLYEANVGKIPKFLCHDVMIDEESYKYILEVPNGTVIQSFEVK